MKVRVPDLEGGWTDASRWQLLFQGLWEAPERICIQEARTAILLLRHLARSPQGRRRKHLIFTDNQAVLGMLCKGRSSAPGLLRLARIAASIEL